MAKIKKAHAAERARVAKMVLEEERLKKEAELEQIKDAEERKRVAEANALKFSNRMKRFQEEQERMQALLEAEEQAKQEYKAQYAAEKAKRMMEFQMKAARVEAEEKARREEEEREEKESKLRMIREKAVLKVPFCYITFLVMSILCRGTTELGCLCHHPFKTGETLPREGGCSESRI